VAVRQFGQRSIRWRLVGFDLDNFGGGLNERDSPSELAPSETPSSQNWTLDQFGALKLRKGATNVATLPGLTGANTPASIFYSAVLDKWFCARLNAVAGDLHLYRRAGDLTGAWTDLGVLKAGIQGGAAFVDFPGTTPKVVIVPYQIPDGGAIGGIWTYDGTTLTNAAATLSGRAVALWQNKVWVAGYPASDAVGNPTRLFWSNLGNPSTWTPATDFVDIRDKDAQRLTGLGVAAGALIVFKKRSTYRVNDSTAGAYQTIDPAAGAIRHEGIVGLRGRLYSWGADSLYESNGIGPGVRVGDKARPTFMADPAASGDPFVVGSVVEDRLLYAYPVLGSGTGWNDRLLEYDAEHGWLAKHRLGLSSKEKMSSFATKEADLYAAIMDGDVIFKLNGATPGADDGTVYASSYKTPWLQPAGGKLTLIMRAVIEGLLLTGGTNTLKVRVYRDWDESSFDEYDVSSVLRGASASINQLADPFLQSYRRLRAVQFEFVGGTAAGDATVRSLNVDALLVALR
jgi:hypothetical protein